MSDLLTKTPPTEPTCPPAPDARLVAVARGPHRYETAPPFSPEEAWPEYPFGAQTLGTQPNPVYAAVREALRLLGLDADRFGTPDWNPLGGFIRPGNQVVIKPNLVRDFREAHPGDEDCLITDGAVIRAMLDYATIALGGRGRLIVADAPHNDADFAGLLGISALPEIQEFYRLHGGPHLEVLDLRPEAARKIDGVIVGHEPLPGDPAGYTRVDLGSRSAFAEIEQFAHLLYGSEYDMGELHRHHSGGRHEYLISRSVLEADCVISLPKLKTHKKVGLTLNLKNLVGINGNKNWLPHHREGTPAKGGDQFADNGVSHRVERAAVARFKRLFPRLGALRPLVAGPVKALGKQLFGDTNAGAIRSGNWYGNDTTWRMTLDLNRILMYADADGGWHQQPVRRFFSLVDGLVAGEGNGPLDPTPRACGLIVAGGNPAAVDAACACLVGFDPQRMPMIRESFASHEWPLASFSLDTIEVADSDTPGRRAVTALSPCVRLQPHFGWAGHVERP